MLRVALRIAVIAFLCCSVNAGHSKLPLAGHSRLPLAGRSKQPLGLGQALEDIGGVIKDVAEKPINAIGNVVDDVTGALGDVLGDVVDFIQVAGKKLELFIKDGKIFDQFNDVVEFAFAHIKNGGDILMKFVVEAGKIMMKPITEADNVIGVAITGLEAAGSHLLTFGQNAAGYVVDGANAVIGLGLDAANNVIDGANNVIQFASGGIAYAVQQATSLYNCVRSLDPCDQDELPTMNGLCPSCQLMRPQCECPLLSLKFCIRDPQNDWAATCAGFPDFVARAIKNTLTAAMFTVDAANHLIGLAGEAIGIAADASIMIVGEALALSGAVVVFGWTQANQFVNQMGEVVEFGLVTAGQVAGQVASVAGQVGAQIVSTAGDVVDFAAVTVSAAIAVPLNLATHVFQCLGSMELCETNLPHFDIWENGLMCPSCMVTKPVCDPGCPYTKKCLRVPWDGWNPKCVGLADLLTLATDTATSLAVAGVTFGVNAAGEVINVAGDVMATAVAITITAGGLVLDISGQALELVVGVGGNVVRQLVNGTVQVVELGVDVAGNVVQFTAGVAGDVVTSAVSVATGVATIAANVLEDIERFSVLVVTRQLECVKQLVGLPSCDGNDLPQFGVDPAVSKLCPSCMPMQPSCNDGVGCPYVSPLCVRNPLNGFKPECVGVGMLVLKITAVTGAATNLMVGIGEFAAEMAQHMVTNAVQSFCAMSTAIDNGCQFADAFIHGTAVVAVDVTATGLNIYLEYGEGENPEEQQQIEELAKSSLQSSHKPGEDFNFDIKLVDMIDAATPNARTDDPELDRIFQLSGKEAGKSAAGRATVGPVLFLLSLLTIVHRCV